MALYWRILLPLALLGFGPVCEIRIKLPAQLDTGRGKSMVGDVDIEVQSATHKAVDL